MLHQSNANPWYFLGLPCVLEFKRGEKLSSGIFSDKCNANCEIRTGWSVGCCSRQRTPSYREFWTVHRRKFGSPEKIFRGEIIQREWRNFHPPCALFLAGVEFHVLPRVLVCFLVEFDLLFACFLVEFDLLFAFGVLSCRILDSASLFILYVHEHNRLSFEMLTVETAVFDCICWFSSSRDRKGQSYPVEYCLESVKSTPRAGSIRVNLNYGTEM